MTAPMLPFGVLLRRWRRNRRMSQEALALTAGSSTRHLSCLETGRAQPSREMLRRPAEHLEVPLRDQNALLLAAGLAPAFQERSLAELENARQAIEQILEAHKPYPASRSTDFGMSSPRTVRCRSFMRGARRNC